MDCPTKLWTSLAVAAITLFSPLTHMQSLAQGVSELASPADSYRQVDACFALDTTGSMSAAIQTAKEKVWFIANEIARSSARPRLRLCLMAYRDRDDSYVTQLTALTPDIDRVHEQLSSLQAGGGGDTPEAVNQALLETVQNAGWQSGDQVLRVIFLIGDAPPKHYPDEPQYPDIVRLATAAGIVINPVLIGNARDTEASFKAIERIGDGRFLHLPAVQSRALPSTPMDQDLVALSARLNESLLPYGSAADQALIAQESARLESMTDGEQIERLAFGQASGRVLHREGDLVQDLAGGQVTLDDLEPHQLPLTLRSMDQAELARSLDQINEERSALRQLIGELLAQRRLLIAEQTAKDSFEYQLSQVLLQQL